MPPGRHPFRVAADRLLESTDYSAAIGRGDRVIGGGHQAFRWEWRALPQSPDEWLIHPATGRRQSADLPWWRVVHLAAGAGDIKDLWEPARFAWAYDLVRAWLLTGDDQYAAFFHSRLRDFVASSPPFRGPHWSCGQETSIRAAALLYAEANLADAPSSTSDAMSRLVAVLAASGERVADAIGYAVSQRNNHGLSEAVGLVLLGSRLEGRHPEAGEWLERGHRLVDRLVCEQFAVDGWYIQHSFTYHRLALDQLVLAERVLRSTGRRLSPAARARLRAACSLLLAVLDSKTRARAESRTQ